MKLLNLKYVKNVFILSISIFLFLTTISSANEDINALTQLSLEEILDIEVSTLSKKEQKLFNTAAATYVITSEDIRRSGATTVVDALRIVPGVQVAQINSNQWTVTIRGFSVDRFANKLLVLIDGRSVYSPLFSGVLWEEIDTLLGDIERIEIIRGPGGTTWGANAVNGIINIITKNSASTNGLYLKAGGGNEEHGFIDLRYGGAINKNLDYRIYGKFFNKDSFTDTFGGDANDSWKSYRGGFRADYNADDTNFFTLQGEIFNVEYDQELNMPISEIPFLKRGKGEGDAFSANLVAKYSRVFSNESKIFLQAYYDFSDRKSDLITREKRHTFDIDFQHQFLLNNFLDSEINWGLGYRITTDKIFDLGLTDNKRTDTLLSAFINDEITLIKDKLIFILGSKFEHNSFTGFEFQPNARILWSPNENNRIWLSATRAVRTPSRIEHSLSFPFQTVPEPQSGLPLNLVATGNEDFESEDLYAFEIGYRSKPHERIFIDLTGFINFYENFGTFEMTEPELINNPTPQLTSQLLFDNNAQAKTYGFEIESKINPYDFWNINVNYSFLKINVDPDDGEDFFEVFEGSSPEHQFKIQSFLDLPRNFEFDTAFYFTDKLDSIGIGDRFRLDARLGWKPREDLEISFVARNLFINGKREFSDGFTGVATELDASFYGTITWNY